MWLLSYSKYGIVWVMEAKTGCLDRKSNNSNSQIIIADILYKKYLIHDSQKWSQSELISVTCLFQITNKYAI